MDVIYTNATKAKTHEMQAKACRALMVLFSVEERPGPTGAQFRQEVGAGNPVLADMLRHGFLGQGDALWISDLSVLSDTPSGLVDVLGKLYGKGIRVFCAAVGGQPDFNLLASLVSSFEKTEARVIALEKELVAQEADHRAELSEFTEAYEKKIMELLHERGIGLTTGLLTAEGSKVARPDEGRAFREKRLALGMTQEEVGQLLNPPLTKAQISRIESLGSSAPHFAVADARLNVERILRDRAAAAKVELEAQLAAFGSVPTISGEEAAAAAIADQFGSVAS